MQLMQLNATNPVGTVLIATLLASGLLVDADDWPQWMGPQRDGVWRETGIVRQFPANGPAVRWRASINAGYAGPAVAGGRVYVMDRVRVFQPVDPTKPGAEPRVLSKERVLCLEETSGKILWQQGYDCPYSMAYPSGPRTTACVDGGRVYALGAAGNLLCLDAMTGKVHWERDFKKDFDARTPQWGFAGHPLVDGNKLICLVGGPGCIVVAFDKLSGKELWRALNAREPGYSPPSIYEAGGCRQLILWHPEALNSLDPETGKVYWTEPFTAKAGLSLAAPRKLGNLLLVTSFYNGSLMMQLDERRPAARVLWRGKSNSERNTDGLHAIICTPFLEDGHIYGVCSYGQLRGLKADTGERLWETFAATTDGNPVRWANAFLVKNGEVFFIANEKGELIIARLSPKGYEELSRARLLEPTNKDCGRLVVWSPPAFANRCVYARNDREIICVSLAER